MFHWSLIHFCQTCQLSAQGILKLKILNFTNFIKHFLFSLNYLNLIFLFYDDSVEYSIGKQLCERLQRGIEYLDSNSMWEAVNGDISKRNVVISGGVACNQRIKNMLIQVRYFER